MTPSSFICKPFIDVSATLKQGITRILADMMVSAVPTGVRVVSVSHNQPRSQNIWVLDMTQEDKKINIETDILGLQLSYTLEAELTAPLPENAIPLKSRGRVLLDAKVAGNVYIMWK